MLLFVRLFSLSTHLGLPERWLRCSPYIEDQNTYVFTCLFICRGYELGKRFTPRDWGVGSDVVTAIFAQSLAGVAYCPIDIVKQTVQTAEIISVKNSCNRVTTSPWEASKNIWNSQGIRGFYRGFVAMNSLWMPWNLIYLTMYESSKRRAYEWKIREMKRNGVYQRSRESQGDDHEVVCAQTYGQVLPAWVYPMCSSSCAAVAAVATHPIDVIKTRLQVMSAITGKSQRAIDVTRHLWENDGFAGFSKGLGARVMTMCVGTSISWFMYEMVKKNLSSK